MPKASKGGWYAVAVGRRVGIYTTWEECCEQVKGFSRAKYKKFPSKMEAEGYISANSGGASTNTNISPRFTASTTSTAAGRSGRAVYAVARGHNPGVYYTWPDCQAQVKGFHQPLFKKFTSEEEAKEFCAKNTELKQHKHASNGSVFKGSTSPSADSSLSDLELEEGGFSPTKPGNDEFLSFSENEEEEEEGGGTEEENNAVLREIAALVNRTKFRTPTTDTSSRTVVYTDGSCLNQGKGPRRAGIGVYWGPGDPRNCSERLWGVQTNQRAELWAAIRALQAGLRAGCTKLEVRTDSQYTIKGVTEWGRRWKQNGYTSSQGKPVQNKELFCCLDGLLVMMDVNWVHVRAHCGEPGNEAADQLAREGAKKPSVNPAN